MPLHPTSMPTRTARSRTSPLPVLRRRAQTAFKRVDILETKAVKVNMITGMTALINCFHTSEGKTLSEGECNDFEVHDNNQETGSYLWIVIVVALLVVAASACSAGLVIGRWLERATAPPPKPKGKGRRRNVSTQSPVTYTWTRKEPRFLPLGEHSHGAWAT